MTFLAPALAAVEAATRLFGAMKITVLLMRTVLGVVYVHCKGNRAFIQRVIFGQAQACLSLPPPFSTVSLMTALHKDTPGL